MSTWLNLCQICNTAHKLLFNIAPRLWYCMPPLISPCPKSVILYTSACLTLCWKSLILHAITCFTLCQVYDTSHKYWFYLVPSLRYSIRVLPLLWAKSLILLKHSQVCNTAHKYLLYLVPSLQYCILVLPSFQMHLQVQVHQNQSIHTALSHCAGSRFWNNPRGKNYLSIIAAIVSLRY